MKKIIIILLFFACEEANVNPTFITSGRWIDNEGGRWVIESNQVTLNEVWEGYVTMSTDRQLNFVVEHLHVNWFYEIELSDSTWMDACRYKTVDSDSLAVRQNWWVKVRKL